MVRIVNGTSETIRIHVMEAEAAQKGYWSWPDNPPTLIPEASMEVALDKILEFEHGEELYVAVAARRHFTDVSGFVSVGSLTRPWQELQESAFVVTVQDSDIIVGEDYYDNKQ